MVRSQFSYLQWQHLEGRVAAEDPRPASSYKYNYPVILKCPRINVKTGRTNSSETKGGKHRDGVGGETWLLQRGGSPGPRES